MHYHHISQSIFILFTSQILGVMKTYCKDPEESFSLLSNNVKNSKESKWKLSLDCVLNVELLGFYGKMGKKCRQWKRDIYFCVPTVWEIVLSEIYSDKTCKLNKTTIQVTISISISKALYVKNFQFFRNSLPTCFSCKIS